MRFVTYVSPIDAHEHLGLIEQGHVLGLQDARQLIDIIAEPDGLTKAAEAIRSSPLDRIHEAEAVIVAPIPTPPSVRDFMAFEQHVVTSMAAIGREVSPEWYNIPTFYFQNPAAIRGARDAIAISPGTEQFDYELEFAAVIGRPGSNITVDDAASHIAGFMLFSDWSARDLQEREMTIGLGPVKGKDTATTIGPYFVTPDELDGLREGKGYRLTMTTRVNGREYSAGNARDLYWSFEQMISYASRGTQLRTGDVIGSGTVGTGCILELSRVHGTEQYPWLQAGDFVELEIDLLGRIGVSILAGREPAPL